MLLQIHELEKAKPILTDQMAKQQEEIEELHAKIQKAKNRNN